MQKENLYFTAGQFAGLHRLNKRTLHYYDDIGLFSPAYKAENGYRYYTLHQSAELENILSLRELGMSIEEIKSYIKQPQADAFRNIAAGKSLEIDCQMKRLKKLKTVLSEKQKALAVCDKIHDGKIEILHFPKRFLMTTPIASNGTTPLGMEQLLAHLQTAWEYSSCKTGCGSYISLDRIREGRFEPYDGLFTYIDVPGKGVDFEVRPQGEYLCGYCIGSWDKIPALYQKMLNYADTEKLELSGNCFETGLNEFAISNADEYVTQIEIRCKTHPST